jgi:hypothetical protein
MNSALLETCFVSFDTLRLRDPFRFDESGMLGASTVSRLGG